MSEDSESFELSFELEQRGGGPARVVRSVETHDDGTRIVTEHEEALPANDPYVRTRQRTVGAGPPHEIVTEFLPSPTRPPTYPAGFPFLANRICHTTESPTRVVSPGVRWPCADPEVVLAALFEISVADGWSRVDPADVPAPMREQLAAAFTRGKDLRLFSRYDDDERSVISMQELDGDL